MENHELEQFAQQFFKNLGCKIDSKPPYLIVSNIPKEFENFIGKKSPLKLVFADSQLLCPVSDDVEFISKGSYLIKAMTEFLGNKGQTAIQKINFDFDSKLELSKYLKLRYCELASVNKTHKYIPLVRFSFLTNFQYQNEKDSQNYNLFIKDGKPISLNIDELKISEGKKEDASIEGINELYNVAKENLKPLIAQKSEELSEVLKFKLEKEIARVKDHYSHAKTELEEHLKKLQNQLSEAEKDPESTLAKIKKIKDSIAEFNRNSEEKFNSLKKEEEFFIQDEVHKHGLNISTKLLSTTILYYPEFKFHVFIKNNEATRMIELIYDPLEKKLSSQPVCDSCKTPLAEIIICNAGHLGCPKCLSRCDSCHGLVCESCLNKKCESCGKYLCKKCSIKCASCGKHHCSSYMRKNHLTGKDTCMDCLIQCPSCRNFTDKAHMRVSPLTSGEVCDRCARDHFGKKTISRVFR